MTARRDLSEIDVHDWARYAHRITPLRGRRPVSPPPGSDMIPEPRARASAAVPAARLVHASPVGIGGQPAGIDTATWQRFHRGKVATTRRLDLHGMTVHAAFHALRSFLRGAHADRVRCVEVITGKGGGEGGGILRREFPMWLNLPDIRPLILAAAHPHAANTGSVRLLLRRPRT